MTKLVKKIARASRADLKASKDGKDGKVGRIEHVPELQARPTLSVATIRADDVPVLLREPPHAENEVGLLKLVSAIDGKQDVAQLAKASHLELEQVRALIASLVSRGFVSIAGAGGATSAIDAEKPKDADYWLKGLKPRTR